MKTVLLASVSIAALFIAAEANAADLAARPYTKAPVMAAPVYSWTGCYVGAHVGWGFGRNNHSQSIGSFSGGGSPLLGGKVNSSGGLFGGQVGCNYQFASNWVFGVQGDVAAADINGRNDDPVALFFGGGNRGTIAIKSDWLASVTGRIGYTGFDNRALFYVKGGGAWIHNKWDLHDANNFYSPSQVDETRGGWTIGAGMEYAFTQNWSGFAEYNYYDFGNGKLLAINDGEGFSSGKQTVQTVKIGVNYKFTGY